jgi:membrane-bound lytic murein transglycosylase D
VRSGDSLDRIARKFGVSIAQLCDWNDINPSRYLRPGQQLRVHVPVREQWQDA